MLLIVPRVKNVKITSIVKKILLLWYYSTAKVALRWGSKYEKRLRLKYSYYEDRQKHYCPHKYSGYWDPKGKT